MSWFNTTQGCRGFKDPKCLKLKGKFERILQEFVYFDKSMVN